MRILFAVARIAFAVLDIVAVVVTYATATQPVNFFNFFGYFTIQGNLIFIAVALVSGIYGLLDRPQPAFLLYLRAAATTYMIIVGIVYNTLLTKVDVGVAVPWANQVVHSVVPIYALLDWLFFGDRPPLKWSRFWLVLVYPIVWLVVVLIRVATDGMSFYPFLDFNKIGGGPTTLYCIGIAIGFAVFGLIVWGLSRVHILKTSRLA